MTGTERKTFQKYYPPDFDPSKIPKAKLPKNRQFVQRVMAPFNMQCNTCGEYIYKAKKFNMRRETADGEDYIGLKIFRFYFRCPNCLADISFKTDLEKCDYAMEHGATRLFEAYRVLQEQVKEEEAKEAEEATNPMKMLEKRTKSSRAEMDALSNLEEIKELNRRQATAGRLGDSLVADYYKQEQTRRDRDEERDELLVQQLFGKKDPGGVQIKRLMDDDDEEDTSLLPSSSGSASTSMHNIFSASADDVKPSIDQLKASSSKFDSPSDAKKQKVSSQKQLLKGVIIKKQKTDPPVKIEPVEHPPEPAKGVVSSIEGNDNSNTARKDDLSSKTEQESVSLSVPKKVTSLADKEATVITDNETSVAPPSGLNLLGDYGSSSGEDSP